MKKVNEAEANGSDEVQTTATMAVVGETQREPNFYFHEVTQFFSDYYKP
jgi:hypothetical protein